MSVHQLDWAGAVADGDVSVTAAIGALDGLGAAVLVGQTYELRKAWRTWRWTGDMARRMERFNDALSFDSVEMDTTCNQ